MNIGGGKGIWIDGSGWDAQYFVWVTEEDGSSYILYDPAIPASYPYPEQVTLRCGGQDSERPAQACVNRATVLQAAKTFSERGERDQSLRWYRDQP